MTFKLPKVTRQDIMAMSMSLIDITDTSVKHNDIQEYLLNISEDNPEVVAYIDRVLAMLKMTKQVKIEADFFVIVALIGLYKALELAYGREQAERN